MLNIKHVTLILLFFVGHSIQQTKPLIKPLNPTAKQLEKWQIKEASWFDRTGLAYALKLLRSITAETEMNLTLASNSKNVIFSPLALKFTLLALSSVGDQTQSDRINRFLFDRSNINDVERQNWKFDFDSYNRNVFNNDERTIRPCLFIAIQPQSFLGLTARANRRLSEYQLERYQKIKLCHEFGLDDTEECLTTFLGDLTDFCEDQSTHDYIDYYHLNRSYTDLELAWHVVRQFHDLVQQRDDSIPSFGYHSYLHRLMFLSKHIETKYETLLEKMADWFAMKQFNLSRTVDMEEWKQFEKDQLWTHQLKFEPKADSLLNVVLFDQKWNHSFYRLDGRWNFYDRNGSVHQLEMIAKHDHFGTIEHRDPNQNRSHLVIRIPYENTKYSLLILLPDIRSNVTEMLNTLEPLQLDYYLKRLVAGEDQKHIVLTLPRFIFSGRYNLGPLLHANELDHFNLNRIDYNGSLRQTSFEQLIKIYNYGIVEEETKLSLEPRSDDEQMPADASIDDFVSLNRPFVYLLVGKYIDLQRKPAFDILVSGIWNGPN